MESKPLKPMSPFDILTTPAYLDVLKIMLPFTPSSAQHMLAVLIKFTEFQYTIRHFFGFPKEYKTSDLLDTLQCYMDPKLNEQLAQVKDLLNMMDMMNGNMSSEQKDIFEQYSHIFEEELSRAESRDKKGESAHERMDESSGYEKH